MAGEFFKAIYNWTLLWIQLCVCVSADWNEYYVLIYNITTIFTCSDFVLIYLFISITVQLKQKNEEAHSLVSRLHEILMKRSPQLANWCIQRRNKLNKSLPFVLDKIRQSPIIDGYRNKYEFSVGTYVIRFCLRLFFIRYTEVLEK